MKNFVLTNATIAFPERIVRPALSAWTRLEPLPLSTDLAPALAAPVADPLWFLARQWQFLEFAGEDAGTPIEVRIEGESAPIARYAPGAFGVDSASRAAAYDVGALPLESVIEREPVRRRHARSAAGAGVHLLRMLGVAKLATLRDLFIAAYPLAVAPAGDDADAMQAEWAAIANGRALDGVALAAALAIRRGADGVLASLPATPVIPADARAAALDVLRRWLTWYDGSVVETQEAGTDGAWNARRQEYAFSASARTSSGELIVVADEYTDGTLDWYSVDAIDPGASRVSLGGGALAAPALLRMRPMLPAPVEFPGKPADRYWEFEDASVHFGGIDAGPTDLTRMLLMEFSLVFGNDWFVVPLRLPVGAFFRATTFDVVDTFGVVTPIPRSRNTSDTAWSVFELSGSNAARDQFFLAPTLAQSLQGDSVEEVALFRDEMANLAWGVERRVQGPSGDAYDRATEVSRRASFLQFSEPPADAALVYRLATSVPDHWIPFVPVPAEGSSPGATPVIQLQRRTILRTDADGARRAVHPRGLLLRTDPRQGAEVEAPLRIEEEEVPREGAVVERAFQFARWFDGRSLLWLGRRKRPGRGEGASGLRFDVSEPV
ncbi:MAG: hypothetical protein ABIP93_08660 [Gemmatimonadaceae bacterium]